METGRIEGRLRTGPATQAHKDRTKPANEPDEFPRPPSSKFSKQRLPERPFGYILEAGGRVTC